MLENIRRHWGALIADGECTFRETWQINPITSLCHGWSATPTYDLSTYILGVSVGAHDRNEVRIAPQPAGLTWARGSYPTRCGDVTVAWDRDGERFALTIDLPPETEASVVLPVGFTPVWRSITVDGVAVKAGDIALTGRHHRVVARV